MSQVEIEEPKGIGFFNVKSGDTHYLKLEAQIQAYINSSDMGINASRGQDFGWKLAPEWVKRVKDFRRDVTQMSILTGRLGGVKPTTVQILYHLYGEELRAYGEIVDENESPYEEEYRRKTADKPKQAPKPAATEPVADDVDEADLLPADDNSDAAAEAATSDKPAAKNK